MKNINNNSSVSIVNNCPSLTGMKYLHSVWISFYKMGPYSYQEELVNEVFKKNPSNTDKKQVWLKCTVLNSMYSTNLKGAFNPMVDKILSVDNIDMLLAEGNMEVVDNIANVSFMFRDFVRQSEFTSFASKYCHFHNPSAYPIFDRHVRRMLYFINIQHPFYQNLTLGRMEDYHYFKEVVDTFIDIFLNDNGKLVSYKDFDRYIWTWAKTILGKDEFHRVINYPNIFPPEIPEDLRLH